jgi:hypothetical protein
LKWKKDLRDFGKLPISASALMHVQSWLREKQQADPDNVR